MSAIADKFLGQGVEVSTEGGAVRVMYSAFISVILTRYRLLHLLPILLVTLLVTLLATPLATLLATLLEHRPPKLLLHQPPKPPLLRPLPREGRPQERLPLRKELLPKEGPLRPGPATLVR